MRALWADYVSTMRHQKRSKSVSFRTKSSSQTRRQSSWTKSKTISNRKSFQNVFKWIQSDVMIQSSKAQPKFKKEAETLTIRRVIKRGVLSFIPPRFRGHVVRFSHTTYLGRQTTETALIMVAWWPKEQSIALENSCQMVRRRRMWTIPYGLSPYQRARRHIGCSLCRKWLDWSVSDQWQDYFKCQQMSVNGLCKTWSTKNSSITQRDQNCKRWLWLMVQVAEFLQS